MSFSTLVTEWAKQLKGKWMFKKQELIESDTTTLPFFKWVAGRRDKEETDINF